MATTNALVTLESRISRLSDKLTLFLRSAGRDNKQIENEFITESDELCYLFDNPDLIPVADICQLGKIAIVELCSNGQSLTQQQYDFMQQWPKYLLNIITSPQSDEAIDGALYFLQSPLLMHPISSDDVQMLKLFLSSTHQVVETPETSEEKSSIIELSLNDESQNKITEPDNKFEANNNLNLTDGQQALIDVMKLELSQIIEPIETYINQATDQQSEVQLVTDVINDYAELVMRVSAGFEAMGLSAYYFICDIIASNLRELSQSHEYLNNHNSSDLLLWPQLMSDCLENWGSVESCHHLAEHLSHPVWPIQLTADEITSIKQTLIQSEIILDSSDEEPRKLVAEQSDISLDIPLDVNPDLFDSLLQELPTQASDFSIAVQKAISGGYVSDLEEAMRIAHTIKGAANTVGIKGLATLSHQIEDILEAYNTKDTLPSGDIADTLILASDCLESMTESLTSLAPQPSDTLKVLQSLLDWANYIDQNGLPSSEQTIVTENIKTEPTQPPETLNDDHAQENNSITPMLRVPATLIDSLLRIVGESIIITGQVQEKLKRTIEETAQIKEQNKHLTELSHELEQLVDIQQVKLPLQKEINSNSGFDSLEMSQYSELHTCAHRLIEAVTDEVELNTSIEQNLKQLDQILLDQNQLNLDAQENVLKTRMVSVNTILPRLQRSVRQACRLTKKQVDLKVSGTETPIDSDVINQLVDPLMHVLRNAVDHGIEDEIERQKTNKPITGTINLDFSREGNNILVRVVDDGSGFNLNYIQQQAIEKGMIENNQHLSSDAIRRLILTPGFTTVETANQLSGRGVGMDIVYTKIQQLKGSLKLDSETGQGSVIELRIPVTLLSTHALLARSGSTKIAISNRGIQQIHYSGAGKITQHGDDLSYQIGDNIYLAQSIDHFINNQEDINSKSISTKTALLVEDETQQTIILVDEVMDTKDLVVKDLGRYVSKQEGIVGATILGDGSVTPVIDLPELVRSSHSSSNTNQKQVIPTEHQPVKDKPTAVVVDDSLSARKSLVQFMEDIGYQVYSAKDGMEAIDKMENHNTDILITDLEMPRMNGLELSSHIRATKSSDTLPIIMITSRSTDKHKQQATRSGVDVYLTKPYSEENLLNHIDSLMATSYA